MKRLLTLLGHLYEGEWAQAEGWQHCRYEVTERKYLRREASEYD